MTQQPETTPITRVIGAHRADQPGPTLIVIGGVHGNEPAGIQAARRILDRLVAEKPGTFRGRFVALAGNLAALADEDPDVRYLHTDLNRMWSPESVRRSLDTHAANRTPEQQEVVELLEVIEEERAAATGPVFILDLHSVSSDSPPFVFVEDSLPARRLAMRFDIPIILGFEEELEGLLVDYCTNTLGCVSLLIEGGVHTDPETVDALEHAVRAALDAVEVWPVDTSDPRDLPHPNESLDRFARGHGRLVYDVRYRYPIASRRFAIDQRLQAFDPIRRESQVIAHDEDAPITTPIGGLLFMPNRQTRPLPGDDGFFIVQRVGYFWLKISATFRSLGVLHVALTALAPGVSRHHDLPHALLVDPDLAAALKREIFHLLGYRILRHGEHQSMSRRRRVAEGAFALIRAASHAVFGRLSGKHVPLSRRPDAWIVALRRLDVDAWEARR